MFNVHMLPADFGDCLWVEYGDAANPSNILIDAGTPGTWARLRDRIQENTKLRGETVFELFVITHVDSDHIGGAIKLFEELGPLGVKCREVWFNGYWHLDNLPHPSRDTLGGKQGEQLSALILDSGVPWNRSFNDRAVMVPETGHAPTVFFKGMKLTLLSPTLDKLQILKKDWANEVIAAGLTPGDAYEVVEQETSGDTLGGVPDVKALSSAPFAGDAAPANGSSIAFLASFEDKTAFFGADSHADVVLDSLDRVAPQDRPPARLHGFKMSHHGSKANTSKELLQRLPSDGYLISTNGKVFGHPNPEAIARVVATVPGPKTLHFNYGTTFNTDWNSLSLKKTWKYSSEYGDGKSAVTVRL